MPAKKKKRKIVPLSQDDKETLLKGAVRQRQHEDAKEARRVAKKPPTKNDS